MSNRLTFSLASLIVLIALGLVFVGTPAKAATFADGAKIADISEIQGAAIDITLPKPTAAGDGDLTASLTDGTTTLSVVDSADPASTEGTDGTLFDNLMLSFDDAGNVKLKGNVSPAVVSEVIVTYTIAEADDSSGTPASIENAILTFAFEVRAQSNLLTFAGADIDNKDDLTVGTYFYEVLPAAQDGIGPLMYSIVDATETATDSGIFTGGNIPAGMTFAESTRTLSGTPTTAAARAVVVYRVTDSTPTTALTRDIPFTVEVKARVNGPSFTIAKVPDAAYTKGHAIEAMPLPMADETNALGSVTYKLEGPDATASDPKLPKGLSFDAATRELSGTPTGDAGVANLTYTATDTAENAKSVPFKITVAPVVSVTAPENVTRILGASPSVDIAIAATLATGGTGTRTLTVDASTLPAGLTFANGKITGDPTAVTATGGSTVTITATDSLGAMKTANFKITVNKAPDITIESADLLKLIVDRTYVANTPIQAEVLPTATGGVGDLSYALEGLPTGITFDAATRILRGTPTAASPAAMYTYVVTDDAFGHIDDDARTAAHTKNMLSVQFSITVSAAPTTTNNAPDFGTQSIDNIVATAGMAIDGVFLPRATDADGDTLTYSLSPSPPNGITFTDSNRALVGTPTAEMAQTPYTYMVSDGKGGTDTIGFFITVNKAANRAPVYMPATPGAISGTVGVRVIANVAATDPDGDTLTYSWDVDEAALGLTLSTSAGIITGIPLKVHTGTHTVTATDSGGLSATRDFVVTISAPAPTPEDPVVAITTTAPTAPQMNSFAIAYTATDPNGDTPTVNVTHTVMPNTATGYTVDSSTAGMVTIMQAAGSPIAIVEVTITATDNTGRTHSQSISVTFAARAETPVVTAPGRVTNLTATPGDGQIMLSWTAPATGSAATSYEYSDNDGHNWNAIAGAGTTHTVMGLTNGQTYSFIVRARNSAGVGGISNEISATPVEAPPAPPAAPAGLTAMATAGAHGSVTLMWTAVSGMMYEYSTDGTTWMAATSPQTVAGLTGGTSYTFSVRVKAAGDVPAGMAATATATPTAAPVIVTPTISIPAKGYLVIVGAGFDANTLPGVMPTEVAGFPADLATFLIAGGTIDVVATGGDVIINELMVATDTNKLGALSGEPTDGQWIELYNKGGAAATGVTVSFSSARPAPAHPAGLQDRLSNTVGQGWNFVSKFGAAVLTGSTHADNPVNFISIRRTNADKEGWNPGHWGTAVESLLFATGRIGTPGAANTITTFTPQPNDRAALNEVRISEVANRMDDSREWIELKGPAGKSLKNWQLSIAYRNAAGELKNDVIFNFPNNDNIKISSNGHLLLTDVNPINGELEADFVNGVHDPVRYKNAVVSLGALPNGGNFILILRHRNDRLNSHEGIEDIAGYADNLSVTNPFKTLWPLRGNAGVISSHNKLVGGKVYARVREGIHGYSATAGNKLNESAFAAAGFTGLGYDRNANAGDPENGGTPGYPRGNFKHNGANAKDDVRISEIMFTTGNGGPARNRNLSQWIEIHNASDVNSVRLADWRLEIVNSGRNADGSQYAGKFSEHVGLSGTIPPNQTYLIVSHVASSDTRLPRERIRVVGKKFNEQLLNPNGFHLTLRANVDRPAGEHVVVDTVGNLNAPATGDRRADARSFAGNAWELSALGDTTAEDNSRISISRRVNANGTKPRPGTNQGAWILTDEDSRYSGLIRFTYYGRTDDRATPGYTIGGALPVSLSKFSPERLDDGTVVVRWATESELDNAGFNILRSETKDGQFTKLNTQLIAGQGTTSERTAYEFVDKTAKPNVVYYYQIQDVSLDGDVATLRTNRLRGHVSPGGKFTTTWGELKALQ